MTRIYKYWIDDDAALATEDGKLVATTFLPKDAKILSVANQREIITIWAEVEPDNALEPRLFVIVGTGGVPPIAATFLGTVLLSAGRLTFHVYEQHVLPSPAVVEVIPFEKGQHLQ